MAQYAPIATLAVVDAMGLPRDQIETQMIDAKDVILKITVKAMSGMLPSECSKNSLR